MQASPRTSWQHCLPTTADLAVSARVPLAVVDTNVWISGLLTRSGAPALLTRRLIRNGQPVFSQQTFAELKDRLWRPKFDRYVTIEQRNALLRDLASIALWVAVPPGLAERRFSRDPDDDRLLHAALAAHARWLISGDQDLLTWAGADAPAGVWIVSPAEALALPEFAQ